MNCLEIIQVLSIFCGLISLIINVAIYIELGKIIRRKEAELDLIDSRIAQEMNFHEH